MEAEQVSEMYLIAHVLSHRRSMLQSSARTARSHDATKDDEGGPGHSQHEPMRKRQRSDQHPNKWRKRGAGGTDRNCRAPPVKRI